jgi:hypothetical protein
MATGYGLDNQGIGVRAPGKIKNFHFSAWSRPGLGAPVLLSSKYSEVFPWL